MMMKKALKYDLANMTNLSIRHEEDWDEYYSNHLKVGDTCERFLHSASLLSDGAFLGWQIDTKTFSSAAFSSPGKEVTMEDIAWIFDPVAATSPFISEWMEDLHTDNRKVYILSSAAGSVRDVDDYDPQNDLSEDGPRRMIERLHEMLKTMAETGAVIRIIACGTMEHTKDHGMILISLPDKMTLRMRSMLSLTFPHLAVKEVDSLKFLPDDCFLKSMHRMLFALTTFKADAKPSDESRSDEDKERMDDFEDDFEDDFWDDENGEEAEGPTDIDELKLSVRAYHCLKRACINTVEELCMKSDDELMNLRNMGRRSFIEIKQKLAAFQGLEINLPLTETSYMAKLDELIGLTDVKEQIKKIAAFAKMKKEMSENGNADISVALNMGFVGNPGTAKTTVARIVAGIFYEIGLLPCNELVEVGRADLVAKYVGHTAINIKEVFAKAKGKVLFIDEAYSLVDDRRGSFGDEAINTIIQEMENNRDKTIVIFAGYPDEMEHLFSRNPGLRSRVPFTVNFSDYSVEEMVKIAELEAKKQGFTIDAQACEKVTAICSEAAHRSDAGNGRFCRNLIENAILGYAARIYGDDGSKDKDCILAAEDFTSPIGMNNKKILIGFHA